jgi:hypothetical protein
LRHSPLLLYAEPELRIRVISVPSR